MKLMWFYNTTNFDAIDQDFHFSEDVDSRV
jgi:hypothetical protein